jgi:hypothetical protein
MLDTPLHCELAGVKYRHEIQQTSYEDKVKKLRCQNLEVE